MKIEPIKTAEEHQAMLSRVELLMTKATPTDSESAEMNQLADCIVAYEKVHYPIDTLADKVTTMQWHSPVGQVPDNWIERWTTFGKWTLHVRRLFEHNYEVTISHSEREEHHVLDIGHVEDLRTACNQAAELAIQTIIKLPTT